MKEGVRAGGYGVLSPAWHIVLACQSTSVSNWPICTATALSKSGWFLEISCGFLIASHLQAALWVLLDLFGVKEVGLNKPFMPVENRFLDFWYVWRDKPTYSSRQEGCPCVAWHRWSPAEQASGDQQFYYSFTVPSLQSSNSSGTLFPLQNTAAMQTVISCAQEKTREWHCEVKISALPVCNYHDLQFCSPCLTKGQPLQNTNAQKLICKGTEVSLKVMCLILMLTFPRNIHPFQKWPLTADTMWILSTVKVTLVSPFSPSSRTDWAVLCQISLLFSCIWDNPVKCTFVEVRQNLSRLLVHVSSFKSADCL